MKLYDPRVKRKIETDNLGIVFADQLIKNDIIEPTVAFWKLITEIADYADEVDKKKDLVRSPIQEVKKM
jgi:hypothetical protein